MTQQAERAKPASEFAALDHCVYMRKATTECGVPGWALFDRDGELMLFDEKRNVIWYHITVNGLTHRWLN